NDLPGQIGMALSSACIKGTAWSGKVETRRFCVVNSDPGSDVRLEPSKRESPDEVPHKCSSINKAGGAAVSQDGAVRQREGSVRATSKAVVKEIPFNSWTKYAGAKNVASFETAKKADIIWG